MEMIDKLYGFGSGAERVVERKSYGAKPIRNISGGVPILIS